MAEQQLLENETIEDLQLNGLRLIQKKDAFRFGMDTVLLADFADIRTRDTVADLGTGNGALIFLLYGRQKGFGWRDLVGMALSGIKTVRNILFIFLLIGIMTALWRASGTIPFIVCQAAKLIRPTAFYLLLLPLHRLLASICKKTKKAQSL